MTWEFGKGSVVTTYLSLAHDVWSFIWEDLKGGSDLKVQSGIYRRLDNLHGWQTMMAEVQQIVYSFIHLSLCDILRVSSLLMCEPQGKRNVCVFGKVGRDTFFRWTQTQTAGKKMKLIFQTGQQE